MRKVIVVCLMFYVAVCNVRVDIEACEGWEPSIEDTHNELTNGASSYLIEKGKPKDLYLPRKAIDNNINTAWVEGKDDDGIGEFLIVDISSMVNIKKIKIMPGYAKNDQLFMLNNRPKELRFVIFSIDDWDLSILKTEKDFESKKVKIFLEWKYELEDKRVFQEINVPNYEKFRKKWHRLAIIIKSVYKGTRYSDTAIAEVRFINADGIDIIKDYDDNLRIKYGEIK